MMHEPRPSFGLLRLSYVSEPDERLSDLGDGKVLIRCAGRPDRVLDRNTGKITEKPYSEYDHIVRDFMLIFAGGIVLVAVGAFAIWLWGPNSAYWF